jgi:hypothetical protein
VEFSHAVDEATINAETVSIIDVALDRAIPSTLSLSGATLTITPQQRLGLITEYRVILADSISAVEGWSMEDEYSWIFRVREGVWHETDLSAGKITAISPNVGLDAMGTVFISWIVRSQSGYCPTTARRLPLLGTPDPAVPLTALTTDCRTPRTSAVGNGLAAVAWEEDTGTRVAQFRDGTWQNAELLTEPYSTGFTDVAILPSGAVHLVSRSPSGMVARHAAANGEWSTETKLLTADRPRSTPALAFDGAGNGLAVWRSRDVNSYEMIMTSSYSAAGGWSDATKLTGSVAPEKTETHYRGAPDLAINELGEAVSIWVRGSDLGAELYANHFVDGQWQEPVALSSERGGFTFQEAPALAAVGEDFVAAWNQAVAGVNNTYTARFDAETRQWSPPELRSAGINGLNRMPRLGADEHRNLLLMWPRPTAAPHTFEYVQARYVHATATWQQPVVAIPTQIVDKLIDLPAPNYAVPNYEVSLPFAMNVSGIAAVAWASRPIAELYEYAENPKLAVFR